MGDCLGFGMGDDVCLSLYDLLGVVSKMNSGERICVLRNSFVIKFKCKGS